MARYDAAYYRRRRQQLRRRQQWLRIWRRLLRGRAGRTSPGEAVVVVVIGAGLALHFGHDVTGASAAAKPSVQDAAAGQPGPAAVKAIAYAEHQLGCSYQWGGTGPCSSGYDCSGLIWAAYRSAGVTIPRTSQAQWAGLPHIPASQLRPGDLILYAGSDGTRSDPGHVVMYIGDGKAVQAYATGWPVMITPLASMDAGQLTGYARP